MPTTKPGAPDTPDTPEIYKATPDDQGVWVDGWWGQYGLEHLIARAYDCGWRGNGEDDAPLIDAAIRAQNELHNMPQEERVDLEILADLGDDAEQWLNEHVAPEGYVFWWYEGEFRLDAEEDLDEMEW